MCPTAEQDGVGCSPAFIAQFGQKQSFALKEPSIKFQTSPGPFTSIHPLFPLYSAITYILVTSFLGLVCNTSAIKLFVRRPETKTPKFCTGKSYEDRRLNHITAQASGQARRQCVEDFELVLHLSRGSTLHGRREGVSVRWRESIRSIRFLHWSCRLSCGLLFDKARIQKHRHLAVPDRTMDSFAIYCSLRGI